MSINNIKKLLLYDWKINSNSLLRTLGVLEVISILLFILFALQCNFFKGVEFLMVYPTIVGSFNFFETIALFVILVWATRVLQNKFTNTQSSVHYIMLPATSEEKALVNHLNFLIAWLIIVILGLVNIVIFSSIVYLNTDHNMSMGDNSLLVSLYDGTIGTDFSAVWSVLFYISVRLVIYFVYVTLCLQFRTHAIIKSILSMVVIFFIYSIYTFNVIGTSLLTELPVDNFNPNTIASIIFIPVLIGIVCLYMAFPASLKERELK